MTSAQTTQHSEPRTAPAPDFDQLWQLPLVLSMNWWNLFVFPWIAVRPFHHVECKPHDQLVVPEPLEEDDERALFA